MAIQLNDEVRERLRLALVTENDLIAALERQQLEPLANPPGCLRGRPTLAVPRPLDPETAEVRQLEVLLRPRDDGSLEVYAVRGLALEGLE